MAIDLVKGQRVSLDLQMQLALVGLGWETNRYEGQYNFDLDASVFLLNSNGKLQNDEDFIFYNNLESRNGAVVHTGDNRIGEEKVDNEVIMIDFSKLPDYIQRISIVVTIYDAEERKQNFGQVSNAYIRIAKMEDEFDDVGEHVLKFDLENEFSSETALVIAEIYKENCEWKFKAIASGYQGGLESIVRSFGGNV